MDLYEEIVTEEQQSRESSYSEVRCSPCFLSPCWPVVRGLSQWTWGLRYTHVYCWCAEINTCVLIGSGVPNLYCSAGWTTHSCGTQIRVLTRTILGSSACPHRRTLFWCLVEPFIQVPPRTPYEWFYREPYCIMVPPWTHPGGSIQNLLPLMALRRTRPRGPTKNPFIVQSFHLEHTRGST